MTWYLITAEFEVEAEDSDAAVNLAVDLLRDLDDVYVAQVRELVE